MHAVLNHTPLTPYFVVGNALHASNWPCSGR
jgi:hypothetical protein